jgi:beta-lactam-binding protein with PASTA domain
LPPGSGDGVDALDIKEVAIQVGLKVAPVLAALLATVLIFDSAIMPRFVRHGSEVEVPDVMTLPLEEAVLRLQEVGLSVRDTLVNASPTVEVGRVMDQAPRPGTRLKPDRGLRLVVSGGRQEQRIPELARSGPPG